MGYVPSLKEKHESKIVGSKAIESKGGSIRYTLQGEYEGRKTLPKTVSKADFEGVYGFDAKAAEEAVYIKGKNSKEPKQEAMFYQVGQEDGNGFTPEKIVPIRTMNEHGRKKVITAMDAKDADTVGSPSPATINQPAPSEDPFPQEPSNASFSAECGDGGQNPCKECGGHPCPRCNAPHPSSHDSIETKDGDVCLPCATDAETRENYFWNDLLGGYMTREEMLEQYPERKDEIDNSRNPEMREDYQPYQESYQPKEIDIEEIERLGMEKDEREIKKLMDEKGLTYEEARQMKMDNAIDQIPHWESNEVKEAFGFGKDEEEEESEEPKEQEFTVVLQEGDKLELTDIEEDTEGDVPADDEPKEEDNDSNEENEEKEAESVPANLGRGNGMFLVKDIEWDTDDEDVDLPTSVWIPNEFYGDGGEPADWLSDKYGFLVVGGYADIDTIEEQLFEAVSAKVTRPVKEEETEDEESEGLSTLAKVGIGLGALAVGAVVLGAEDEGESDYWTGESASWRAEYVSGAETFGAFSIDEDDEGKIHIENKCDGCGKELHLTQNSNIVGGNRAGAIVYENLDGITGHDYPEYSPYGDLLCKSCWKEEAEEDDSDSRGQGQYDAEIFEARLKNQKVFCKEHGMWYKLNHQTGLNQLTRGTGCEGCINKHKGKKAETFEARTTRKSFNNPITDESDDKMIATPDGHHNTRRYERDSRNKKGRKRLSNPKKMDWDNANLSQDFTKTKKREKEDLRNIKKHGHAENFSATTGYGYDDPSERMTDEEGWLEMYDDYLEDEDSPMTLEEYKKWVIEAREEDYQMQVKYEQRLKDEGRDMDGNPIKEAESVFGPNKWKRLYDGSPARESISLEQFKRQYKENWAQKNNHSHGGSQEDMKTCGNCGGESDADNFNECVYCSKQMCNQCGDYNGDCTNCGVAYCYDDSGCGDCGEVCKDCECDCNSMEAESGSKNLKMALGITAVGIGLAAVLGKDKITKLFDKLGL